MKQLFIVLGQFETHEFVESFKAFGKHAFFPHDRHELEKIELPVWFGRGSKINDRLSRPFKDIAIERSDLSIGFHYISLWFFALPVISHLIALDNYLDVLGSRLRMRLVSIWRTLINTTLALPSYIQSRSYVAQAENIKSPKV